MKRGPFRFSPPNALQARPKQNSLVTSVTSELATPKYNQRS